MEQENKNSRILFLYTRLIHGQVINKKSMAEHFGVSERSIQRDIDSIRNYVEVESLDSGECNYIVYDRKANGYRMERMGQKSLSNAEILAVSKILLDSRAFEKGQMNAILDKLLACCVPEKNQKLVSDLLLNERYHYMELSQKPASLELLWKLGQAVKEARYLNLEYYKVQNGVTVRRKVKPVAIMFSEYYFYLAAYIEDINKDKEFAYADDPFPTIYRVDRIQSCQVLKERFRIPYGDRFKEGEFRKRIQFMYGGRLKRIQFKYVGYDVNAILDRLPTAEIICKDEEGWTIRAEVFGDGVDMWLRSQGENIQCVED